MLFRSAMPICNRTAVLIGGAVSTLRLDTVKENGRESFSAALKSVDPLALDSLFMDAVGASKLVCDNASVNAPMDFEKHFSQFRGDVYPVCCWVLWETVKDFFPQLGTFAQVAKAAAEKAFQSQKDGRPITGSAV